MNMYKFLFNHNFKAILYNTILKTYNIKNKLKTIDIIFDFSITIYLKINSLNIDTKWIIHFS